MGKVGAECDRIFTSRRRSLTKPEWDKERVGMLCTDSSNYANLKAALLKLCGDTGVCTKDIVDKIEDSSKRIDPIVDKATKAKGGSVEKTIRSRLKLGDKGQDVSILHRLLFEKGYSSSDESYGDFDTYTERMVKAFQSANGLLPDGVVGPQTWNKLDPSIPIDGGAFKGTGETIIPFAIQMKNKMKTRGGYEGGYPKGILIHFTAGQWEKYSDMEDTMNWGVNQGFAFLGIASTGEVLQAHPVNLWGYHAGESSWARGTYPLIGSVSDDLIGIEMANPGRLEKRSDGFYTWFNKKINPDIHGNPIYVTEDDYDCPEGWYLPYSKIQEASLTRTIIWLLQNDPYGTMKIDNILGHHEVSGKLGLGYWRKNDPGGALSMPMDDYREFIERRLV
jgi:N-acetyl-anhydromuramyl-L-alanine amidase AmpD